jgi:Cu(I)/Ag(I) efflux system membrane fusion protein
MKINKIYLIAMGTLLSTQAMSANNHDHNNHSSLEKEIAMTDKPLLQEQIGHKVGEKMFVCPMHPEIIQPEAGSCPICGMDLVEKDMKKMDSTNEVLISAGMQQNMNIKTAVAKMKRISPKIKSYGKVKYNEDTITHQHIRVEGWVESSLVLQEGQYIEKDQKIFDLYSEELIVAQQDLILTLKSKNKELIKRSKKRLKLLGINNKVIDKIIETKEVFYTIPFYSESSGYVKDFDIRKGMYVNANTKLFSIVDQSSYWINGYVFEEDKNNIKLGSKVKVSINDNEYYPSKVDYVYPELDPETLSFKYRVTVDDINESKNLKPNMIVNLELKSKKKIMGLFIPIESLIQTENKNKVVVKTKTGFIVKEVLVGFKDSKQAQILKGLSLKDEVVTSGQFLIDSEASLVGATIRIGDNNE